MKKILVTGCNGFIGTNFVHMIYSKYPDLEIFNIDCLDFDISKNNHDGLDKRYHFVHGSILDKALVRKVFLENKFDQVINFAANSHVDNSIKNREPFIMNNVLGTQILLDMALEFEIPSYLQISTDEVYGSINFDEPSTTEEACLEPNNPYSASKAGADCLVRSYFKTFQLPVIITRSSNNFGPYQYPEKLIPVIISKAMKDQAIPVYGDGSNIRDWIFVEDNCAGVDFARLNGKPGEIYNIAGDNEVKNLDLVKKILKLLAKPESLISFVEDRKGHDFRYSMDGTKLKKLGFDFEIDFDTKLKRTIDWYQSNLQWLK